jgi:acylphosphatase
MIRRRVIYRGAVQGVGFRWTALRAASGGAATGYVRNLADGGVELVLEGEAAEVAALVVEIEERMQPYIGRRETEESAATGEFSGFEIRR